MPCGDALALGLERLALRLGVERQEVARRHRVDPLLHREADARLGLGVALDGLGHLHQRARVQQVHLRGVGRGRVARPSPWRRSGGRPALARLRPSPLAPLQRAVPQRGGACSGSRACSCVSAGSGRLQARQRLPDIAHGGADGLRRRSGRQASDCGMIVVSMCRRLLAAGSTDCCYGAILYAASLPQPDRHSRYYGLKCPCIWSPSPGSTSC